MSKIRNEIRELEEAIEVEITNLEDAGISLGECVAAEAGAELRVMSANIELDVAKAETVGRINRVATVTNKISELNKVLKDLRNQHLVDLKKEYK